MLSNLKLLLLLILFASCGDVKQRTTTEVAGTAEQHRPQVHFTPPAKWMNDPNGMVYVNGTYHLFYQHYPDSTVWGPMHWGHATSTDLVYWQHQPIALFPDSLGYIFSGSAVVDSNNTSGFGKEGKVPLVAIFTHHDPRGEKTRNDYQNQSIAYSLDDGKTWTKYAGNPVLKNPGIVVFRDPKVNWNEDAKKWIMTLATKDRVTFYSSPDLKTWAKESEFGNEVGATAAFGNVRTFSRSTTRVKNSGCCWSASTLAGQTAAPPHSISPAGSMATRLLPSKPTPGGSTTVPMITPVLPGATRGPGRYF